MDPNNNNNNPGKRRLEDNDQSSKRFRGGRSLVLTGRSGRPVDLEANYFRVSLADKFPVSQHSLEFDPPVESRGVQIGLLKSIPEVIGSFFMHTNNELYLPMKLPDAGVAVVVVSKPRDGSEPKKYQVKIKPIAGAGAGTYFVLNLYTKKLTRAKGFVQMGTNYFDPSRQISEKRFNMWPGFKIALEKIEAGPYLLAELVFKLVSDVNVREILKRDGDMQVIGSTVVTTYNNMRYRITNVIRDRKMRDIFFTDNKTGAPVSLWDYMDLKYPDKMNRIEQHQPVLVSAITSRRTGETRTAYLIPQLCVLCGVNDAMRSDSRLMKDFREKTLVAPGKRREEIKKLVAGFSDPKLQEAAHVSGWHININKEMLALKGRVLPPEDILMIDTRSGKLAPVKYFNADWKGALFKAGFYRMPKNQPLQWFIVYPKLKINVDQVLEHMQPIKSNIGLKLNIRCFIYIFLSLILCIPPRCFGIESTTGEEYERIIKAFIKDNKVDFVLCILPDENADRYAKIKQINSSTTPIISQCVLVETLFKRDAVYMNFLTQIVHKTGGGAWILEYPMFTRPAMVVGINTAFHAGRLVVALTASTDASMSKYYSRKYPLPAGEIRVPQLTVFIKEAANEYLKQNQCYPLTYVIYRSGLGESQMKPVIDDEYATVQKLLEGNRALVGHELVYVVVQKKISTRFFKNGDNVDTGTVIDTAVVARREQHAELGTTCDFFHVSQTSRTSGTLNPVRYWVKHPRLGEPHCLTIDEIQLLTDKLCHAYYNWAGTVSVPAPCKYAETYATLAVKTQLGEVHHNLHNFLHFL